MSLRHGFVRSVRSATIADATSLSDEVILNGLTLVGVVVPSGWDAADITLEGSVDGTNFFDVHDDAGNELTITAAASRYITVDSTFTAGLQRIKVRSGTSALPVNQTGAVTIQLVLVD